MTCLLYDLKEMMLTLVDTPKHRWQVTTQQALGTELHTFEMTVTQTVLQNETNLPKQGCHLGTTSANIDGKNRWNISWMPNSYS